jgi:hypothetical protein
MVACFVRVVVGNSVEPFVAFAVIYFVVNVLSPSFMLFCARRAVPLSSPQVICVSCLNV